MPLPPGRKPLDSSWFCKHVRMAPHYGPDGWNFPRVTRVEVIDDQGRSYSKWNCHTVEAVFQDDGATMKIFLTGYPKNDT